MYCPINNSMLAETSVTETVQHMKGSVARRWWWPEKRYGGNCHQYPLCIRDFMLKLCPSACEFLGPFEWVVCLIFKWIGSRLGSESDLWWGRINNAQTCTSKYIWPVFSDTLPRYTMCNTKWCLTDVAGYIASKDAVEISGLRMPVEITFMCVEKKKKR